MTVTIKDIAASAGVSYSTVSKALNDSPLVKSPTKKKILQIAREMGYQPNFAAQRLVSKQTKTIGLIWPTIERTALSMLAAKINEKISDTPYSILLSINDIKQSLEMFSRFQVDGLIVFEQSEHISDVLEKAGIPLLVYGISGKQSYSVVNPGYQKAMEKAVNYLTRLGHHNISFIGDFTSDSRQKEKYKGFCEALKKENLTLSAANLIDTDGLNWYDGYSATSVLLASANRPTAIIGGSYEISSGIIRAVREKGLAIPEDISLIGYDNIPQMANLEVPLTSVGVPLDAIAEEIVKDAIELIEGKNKTAFIKEMVPEIIERASCTSIPAF